MNSEQLQEFKALPPGSVIEVTWVPIASWWGDPAMSAPRAEIMTGAFPVRGKIIDSTSYPIEVQGGCFRLKWIESFKLISLPHISIKAPASLSPAFISGSGDAITFANGHELTRDAFRVMWLAVANCLGLCDPFADSPRSDATKITEAGAVKITSFDDRNLPHTVTHHASRDEFFFGCRKITSSEALSLLLETQGFAGMKLGISSASVYSEPIFSFEAVRAAAKKFMSHEQKAQSWELDNSNFGMSFFEHGLKVGDMVEIEYRNDRASLIAAVTSVNSDGAVSIHETGYPTLVFSGDRGANYGVQKVTKLLHAPTCKSPAAHHDS